jgi:beta-lactam-binding protein with PASTA domain
VPKLRGKTLRGAGHAIRRARCRIGRIARKRARKGKRGRVLTQSPRAGARRAGGTRVKLTLRR